MAYKINSFNYTHIRNSIFRNGIATTSKAYGIDKSTLRYVKNNSTFEEYRDFIAKKSREQYERRIERQKKRMFGNGLHFDGKVTINSQPKEEPKDNPFDTSEELGIAKTIVTEVKEHETPKDILPKAPAKTTKSRTPYPTMTAEMYNIAVQMARDGALKQDICARLGFPYTSALSYQLSKNPAWDAGFKRACEEGREKYLKNWGQKTGGRNRFSKTNQPTVSEDGLTPYERGLKTGAEKMGMTVEEYKKYRKDKMAEGRRSSSKCYGSVVKNTDTVEEPKPVVEESKQVKKPATIDKPEPVEEPKPVERPVEEPKPVERPVEEPKLEQKEEPVEEPEKEKDTVVYEVIREEKGINPGLNHLFTAIGDTLKVIGIGVLALLLALAAQIIATALK